MASIYSNNMREFMDGLAEAVKTAGKEDEFFHAAIDSLGLALRLGLVELDDIAEDTCPYAWMFPENFDERDLEDQVMLQNSVADLYKAGMMLLGRDVIAELNPGRSKGYIDFIRGGPHPDEDGKIYSNKRLREFNDIVAEIPQTKRADVMEELLVSLHEIGGDFSHPEADAALDRLKRRAKSLTPGGIRERAAKGLEALRKRVKV
jgi:hypothetical protein